MTLYVPISHERRGNNSLNNEVHGLDVGFMFYEMKELTISFFTNTTAFVQKNVCVNHITE